MKSKTTVAAAVAGSALALTGIVAGATAAAADPTPTPSAGPSASSSPSADPKEAPNDQDRQGPGRHGGPGGVSAAALAEKLGLTEDKVAEALQAIRQELRPDRDTAPDAKPAPAELRSELAKLLGEKLGVEQSAVEQALTELREAAQADGIAALKERLAEAVKAGTLTQAEADAVVKAAEAGVIPTGPGRR